MSETITIAEVVEGDSLPGLDNGYVFEVDTDHDLRDGYYNTSFGRELTLISMHDALGNEFFLLADPEMRVEVDR